MGIGTAKPEKLGPVSRKRLRRFALAGLVVTLAAVALALRAYWDASGQAEGERAILAEEFDAVQIMPGSMLLDRASVSKPGQARVGAVFASTASYETLRTYYDPELARSGWQFDNERALRGAVVACYKRNDHWAALQYASESKVGWNYAIDFIYGQGACP